MCFHQNPTRVSKVGFSRMLLGSTKPEQNTSKTNYIDTGFKHQKTSSKVESITNCNLQKKRNFGIKMRKCKLKERKDASSPSRGFCPDQTHGRNLGVSSEGFQRTSCLKLETLQKTKYTTTRFFAFRFYLFYFFWCPTVLDLALV